MADNNFRNTSWGMTLRKVRSMETSAKLVAENDDSLFYLGEIAGYAAHVSYNFTNDRLRTAAYIIDNYNDVNDLEAYDKLEELLTKKYGEPLSSGITQKHPEKKLDTCGKIAEEIASGLASLRSFWKTSTTVIILSCIKDDEKHNTKVYAIYSDVKVKSKERKTSYEDDIGNL